jgi:hypothetical protein
VSLFLGMHSLNHYFSDQVKHCLSRRVRKDNSHMPQKKRPAGTPSGAAGLAKRITSAMDSHEPKLTLTRVAEACGVTVQAVHGWRSNGRVAKHHLLTLADLTGKDPSYFLSLEPLPKNGAVAHNETFQVLQRAWDTASQDQKEILLGVAKGILSAQRGKRAGKT